MKAIDWRTESVRISAVGPDIGGPQPLFEKLVGREPTEATKRSALGQLQETGLFEGILLTLAQQPGRIDALLSDSLEANTSDPTQPGYKPLFEIGAFAAVLGLSRRLAANLLEAAGAIGLLAYAPTLIHHMPSRQDAYEALREFLPKLDIDPSNDENLLWQINRPRHSARLQTKVNRLCRWHVLTRQILTLGAVVTQGSQRPFTQMPPRPPVDAIVALRLEMDINIQLVEPRFFRGDSAVDLVTELAQMAEEIAQKGDVR